MFLLFLKCVVLFVNLLAIPSASQPQAASQLLQFRDSMPEASRLLLQWNQTSSRSDHCHWPGVSCYSAKDFRVRSLNFSSFGLSGVLESSISNLCRLPDLVSLDLSGNNFSGTVPALLGTAADWQLFFSTTMAFLGPFRVSYSNQGGFNSLTWAIIYCLVLFHLSCHNLTILYAYDNNLEGEISNSFWGLRNLQELVLTETDLGKNSVPGLVKVDLTGNHLTGEIPTGICSGNNLLVLTLGNNLFTGSFPTEIIKCNSLTRVILKNNLLQGSIPDDMENKSSISYFDLRGNAIEGKIPSVFGFWSNLSMIDLSENKFSGLIPQEFGRLQNLEVLRISSNRLTGEIPPELARCPRITELDLSKNELSGGIPVEVVSSLTLKIIRLQDNKLTGVIPNSFSNSQSLHELQLGNNMLEGTIPCSLSKVEHFSSLLNLSMNQLSGEIPKCLGNLDKLEILDISSNNFSGEIPSETNNMASLSFVNISFNHLRGQIPAVWAKILELHPEPTLGNPRLCSITTKSSSCESRKKSHTRGLILAGIIIISTLLMACLLALNRISEIQKALGSEEGGYIRDKIQLGDENSKSGRHRNVLRMGGYSIRDGYGFIVTEYMPEGTLYYLLHQRRPQVALNWETRYRIALGIAQGLSYLHHDCVPQIIHRDIKSDNILLDSELEPKIADFGAAKMEPDSDESPAVSAIVGTLGYIAPEIQYWEKEDLYEALQMMDLALQCTEWIQITDPQCEK
ncbi:UNVERIFIED_CONTAM: Leucine-rich repeat receptor-like serine/threonine-protein kinase BAM2 [Sesamum radiatum]|uniref:non-specific serine/threonine protein kinase n=1 Tax=Sesamum radiatum TaxID=300843 RepID=A0AAW2JZF8_SESRA